MLTDVFATSSRMPPMTESKADPLDFVIGGMREEAARAGEVEFNCGKSHMWGKIYLYKSCGPPLFTCLSATKGGPERSYCPLCSFGSLQYEDDCCLHDETTKTRIFLTYNGNYTTM